MLGLDADPKATKALPAHADRLIRADVVCMLAGFSRNHLYVLMRCGQFPKSMKIGVKAVRWSYREVAQWVKSRERTGA